MTSAPSRRSFLVARMSTPGAFVAVSAAAVIDHPFAQEVGENDLDAALPQPLVSSVGRDDRCRMAGRGGVTGRRVGRADDVEAECPQVPDRGLAGEAGPRNSGDQFERLLDRIRRTADADAMRPHRLWCYPSKALDTVSASRRCDTPLSTNCTKAPSRSGPSIL